MKEYEIKNGIPVPPKSGRPRRLCRYPFALMAIGDCFSVPVERSYAHTSAALLTAARTFKRHHPGYNFTTRIDRELNEVFCWRIA